MEYPQDLGKALSDFHKYIASDMQVSIMRLEEEVKFLRHTLKNIENAINQEGPVPNYHRHVMRKHRAEWPVLWKALDNAMKVLNGKKEVNDD